MQKLLISSLLLIACVSVVSAADWFYYVTYSDSNCTTPVAVQITSGRRWCDAKRSAEEVAQSYQCQVLQGYEPHSIYYAPYCKSLMPNLTETESLPVVITTYNAENCSVEPIQVHYFAENYNGIFFGLVSWDSVDDQVIHVNTTCSSQGVLGATLCPDSAPLCTELSASEECAYSADFGLSFVQSGCVALPPSAPSATNTPSDNTNTPSGSTNGPSGNTNGPSGKPATQAPGTSPASKIISAGALCIAAANLLIMF